MKKVILMLIFLLFISNTGCALDLRQNVIKEQKPAPVQQAVVEEVEEEVPVTTAFVCLVKAFNMCYPYGQIDETILEDTWKLVRMPLHDLSQGLNCFARLETVRNVDYIPKPEKYRGYKVHVGYIKNTQPVMGMIFCLHQVRICTAEDLKNIIADKNIAYVHIGENSDDRAYAVIGIKGNKAIAFDGKTEVEIGFDELVGPANYIMVFKCEFR